jgi:hypothetical protein
MKPPHGLTVELAKQQNEIEFYMFHMIRMRNAYIFLSENPKFRVQRHMGKRMYRSMFS